MNSEEILAMFRQYDAFLEGHFLLTSGLHSPHYFQCARVLQHPGPAEKLGRELAAGLGGSPAASSVTTVLSPAMGGLIIGHELGRALGCRAIFTERVEGRMKLRRFDLGPGERVAVVEDVVTTGGSLLETAAVARDAGAEVAAVCAIVDRSRGVVGELRDLVSLVRVDAVTHEPGACPLCEKGLPLVKPGSRASKNGGSN